MVGPKRATSRRGASPDDRNVQQKSKVVRESRVTKAKSLQQTPATKQIPVAKEMPAVVNAPDTGRGQRRRIPSKWLQDMETNFGTPRRRQRTVKQEPQSVVPDTVDVVPEKMDATDAAISHEPSGEFPATEHMEVQEEVCEVVGTEEICETAEESTPQEAAVHKTVNVVIPQAVQLDLEISLNKEPETDQFKKVVAISGRATKSRMVKIKVPDRKETLQKSPVVATLDESPKQRGVAVQQSATQLSQLSKDLLTDIVAAQQLDLSKQEQADALEEPSIVSQQHVIVQNEPSAQQNVVQQLVSDDNDIVLQLETSHQDIIQRVDVSHQVLPSDKESALQETLPNFPEISDKNEVSPSYEASGVDPVDDSAVTAVIIQHGEVIQQGDIISLNESALTEDNAIYTMMDVEPASEETSKPTEVRVYTSKPEGSAYQLDQPTKVESQNQSKNQSQNQSQQKIVLNFPVNISSVKSPRKEAIDSATTLRDTSFKSQGTICSSSAVGHSTSLIDVDYRNKIKVDKVFTPKLQLNTGGGPNKVVTKQNVLSLTEDGEVRTEEVLLEVLVHNVDGVPQNIKVIQKSTITRAPQEVEYSTLATLNQEGREVYECGQCSYHTDRRSNFYKHKKKHLEDRPFHCTECDYQARTSTNLKRHNLTHTNERRFECPQCDLKFKQKIHMDKHINYIHGSKNIKCSYCDYTCANEVPDLKLHLKRKHLKLHPDDPPAYLECAHCGFLAGSKKDLKQHSKFHKAGPELKLFCEHCSFVTDARSRLERHKLTHSQAKPYACEKCDYRATQKEHIQRHMRTRHGVEVARETRKPKAEASEQQQDAVSFHIVPESFTTSLDNKTSKYEPPNYSDREKVFGCSHCTMKFVRLISLYKHLHTQHSELLPKSDDEKLACVVCDFKAPNHKALLVHMRKHTSQEADEPDIPGQLYMCVLCKYMNSKRRNLYQHLKKKHKISIMVRRDGTASCVVEPNAAVTVVASGEGHEVTEIVGIRSDENSGEPHRVVNILDLANSLMQKHDVGANYTVGLETVMDESSNSMSDAQTIHAAAEAIVDLASQNSENKLELSHEQLSQLSSGDFIEINGETYKVEFADKVVTATLHSDRDDRDAQPGRPVQYEIIDQGAHENADLPPAPPAPKVVAS